MTRSAFAAAMMTSMFAIIGAASAADVKAIAVMTPEEPTDYGWNQQGHDAAKAVAEKFGLQFIPATGLGYGDIHPQLREVADDGASLIIAHASGYNTAAPEVGAEKNVPVAIVDRPDANKAGAIADYTLSGHEGAYLAGILAAKTSTTKSVGIVVSGEPPSWNSQSAAFAQGVKATDPAIKILYAVIGPAAYSDAAGGRRVTAKSTGGGKVYFIDVIGDKTAIDKGNLLSSVVWNLVPVYTAMVEDLKADTFGTHGYSIQLKDDSVHLLKTKNVSEDAWAAVEAEKAKIIDGSMKIEPVWDAKDVRALMSSVTDAPAQ
jgi:simple sugar transport system substrate-binding protein